MSVVTVWGQLLLQLIFRAVVSAQNTSYKPLEMKSLQHLGAIVPFSSYHCGQLRQCVED